MVDSAWQLFSQTGNIEAYLLLKELEDETDQHDTSQDVIDTSMTSID